MSDVTASMSVESPPDSPRPLPTRPFAMPLSPRSAATALSLAEGDPEILSAISNGLIATIQKHTRDTRIASETKDARITELEQTLVGYIPTSTPPDGYEQNDHTRAPHFTIPIQDGFYQPAHWVKQLDDGRVAGYPKEYTITDEPHIGEVYAIFPGADDSDDNPILPMQPWLHELFKGPTNNYNTLYKEVQRTSNWETQAEVQRFREYEHSACDIQRRIEFLQAELRGVKQAQDATQGRLEGVRLDRLAANLRTLPNMGRRSFGEFRPNTKRRYNRQ